MSATADAYDREEAAAPIAYGSKRCAACGQIKPIEGDGMCGPCLNFRTVPVVAHVPKPRYRVTVYGPGRVVVFGPRDFVTERAVTNVMEMFSDEDHTFSVDYLNSKAGVLR